MDKDTKNIVLGQNIDTKIAVKLGQEAIRHGRVNFFTFNFQTGSIDAKSQSIIGSLTQILPENGLNLDIAKQNYEINLIKQALEQSDGVKAHAAKKLGMGRTTLVERMKRLKIDNE